MILSHNAAIFIHVFNHSLGRIQRDLQELRAEETCHRLSKVMGHAVEKVSVCRSDCCRP